MKSSELRQLAAAKLAEANAIIKSAADGLTDEQATKVAELNTEHDRLQNQADIISKVEGNTSALNEIVEPAPKSYTVKERFEEDPNKGFKTIKHFLNAIVENQLNGKADQRLKALAAGGDEHHTQDNQRGGYLLPGGFLAQLLTTPAPDDPIGNRTMRVPIGMNTNSIEIPARVDKDHSSSVAGGLTVSRRTETQAIATSQMAMEKVKLELHGLAGAAYASEELLAASPISIVSLLSNGFRDAFVDNRVNEILNGTGTGEYEGVNNSPALITVAAESGPQAADTIVYANLTKMYSRLWGKNRGIWLYNHDCLPTLMSMTAPDGALLWAFSAREGEPNRLMGLPAYATEYTATVGDAGDLMLLNLNEYLEADRGNVDQAESIHVRFLNNERTFRFLKYSDGRGWWRTPLTPKNSATTLSPFVRLGARTGS